MFQISKSMKFLNFSIITSICVLSAINANAQKEDNATTPILTFKSGATLNMGDFRTYQDFIMDVKGPSGSPLESLQDIVLAECTKDLYTTGPKMKISNELTEQARMFLNRKLHQAIVKETTVTQEGLEKWAKENAEKYTERESVKARHFFLQVDDNTPTSSTKVVADRIEKIRSEITDEKSFIDAVKKYSESGTRSNDGDMGERYFGQHLGDSNRPMNPILDTAMFKLQKGELSPVLKTKTGMHLIFCIDHKTTKVPTLQNFLDRKILPNAALSTAFSDKIKSIIEKEKADKNIKPAELKKDEKVTTDTVLFTIGDKAFSAKEVGDIYGDSFLQYFATITADSRDQDLKKSNTKMPVKSQAEEIAQLQNRLCDMFAQNELAIDMGLDKDNAAMISILTKQKAFEAYFAELVKILPPVKDDEVEKFFNDNLDNPKYRFRVPEYAGYVATVEGTEEQAQEILNRLKSLDDKALSEEIAKISTDDRKTSGGFVQLHPVNTLTDTPARQLDNFASRIDAGNWCEKPNKMANGRWFLVKITQKEKGNPIKFDNKVKSGLKQFLANKAEQELRKQILFDIKAKGLYTLDEDAKKMGFTDLVDNSTN